MNWRRNKKSFFSLSWLLKLKKNINGSAILTKNQDSDRAQNSKKPESFPREIDWNRQKWKGCKMKATKIEDLKKAKMNEEIEGECSRVFDRFAVVKSSVDPKKDFRDSMVEMITENGILRPGELEELLACYLTLNHDEYHDLIVQVFRDIWLELLEIRASSRIALEDL